jgi:DNA-binding ferritin-like protein (Dps family)
LWETITGSALTRECKAFEARVQALPTDYQEAWGGINVHLAPFGGFTDRSLMPILDDALGLLEVAAADGQSIHDVLGEDIPGFCAALAGAERARSYRDRWRAQLNRDIARKLDRLGV